MNDLCKIKYKNELVNEKFRGIIDGKSRVCYLSISTNVNRLIPRKLQKSSIFLGETCLEYCNTTLDVNLLYK